MPWAAFCDEGRESPPTQPSLPTEDISYHEGEFVCVPEKGEGSEVERVDRFNCSMKPVKPTHLPSVASVNCAGWILEFEDVVNATGTGFDDPFRGAIRRETVCQVFLDLSTVIDLGGATPDILIREAEFDGQGPLASASPSLDPGASGCIAGALHEHITTGIDPTPAIGDFDAEIRQVDFGARIIGANTVEVNDDWTVIPVSDLDLYSVILHEATHALGFFSLIGPSGVSVLHGGAYSLYDEFLVDNAASSDKLVSPLCSFQGTAADLVSNEVLYNTPATHNSIPQPVYSPPVYDSGSSLSHFDDVRGLMRYVMRPSTSGGADRDLTGPELNVLCDLGYTLFGIWCTNQAPIGVDDDDLTMNVTTPGEEICIDVLANDSDPDFDPLQIAPGSVLITNSGGTTSINGPEICYTPSSAFCGTAVIHYQPSDGQQLGNVTQLLVDVQCTTCGDNACSLVCNGGFEEGLPASTPLSFTLFSPVPSSWPLPPCASPTANWCGQIGSPDYFIRDSVTPNWSIPTNFFTGNAPGGEVDTHNGAPNNRYIGMQWDGSNSFNEGAFTQLAQPLDGSGATTYELDFWAYTVSICSSCPALDAPVEVFLDDVPPINSADPSPNALMLGVFTVPRDQWNHIVVPPFTVGFDYEFLVIRASGAAPPGTDHNIFIDDVFLGEVSDVNVDIIKWVDDPMPEPGQTITYTVAVCNLDSTPITNVTIEDVLPPGLTYNGIAFNAYPLHTFATIGGQSCSTVNLNVTVDLAAPINVPITNCASLVSQGSSCGSSGAGSQCIDIIVSATDVGVTKTVSTASPVPGNAVDYQVTVTNFGPAVATNVIVNDLLPAGVTYLTHTAPGGTTYNSSTGDFVIPTLDVGSTVTLKIYAEVVNGCGVTNVATLTAMDQTDLDTTNNQASASFGPCVNNGGGSGIFVDSGQLLGGEASLTVDLGDIDNDGDLDAVVGNFRQPARVWINDGQGFFSAGQGLNTWEDVAVRLGDFNADGALDLFVADNTGPGTVWLGFGNGILFDSGQSLGGANSLDAALADLDSDGDLDVMVANNGGNQVWSNNGAGGFSAGQSLGSAASWGVALGRLDFDPWPDAFFANAGSGTSSAGDTVWRNVGGGNLTNTGQSLGSLASRKVALADLDGDFDLDAVVRTVPGQANQAWQNNGAGLFSAAGPAIGSSGNALDLGDVDNDGFADAFFAHNGGNHVFRNDGAGNLTFTDTGQSLGSSNSRDVKLGDLDGDGDLDAFVVNLNQPNKVWFNVGNVYCIDGTATGADYSWQLQGNGVNVTQLNAPGVASGSGSDVLAQAFVDSIIATAGSGVVAAITASNNSCFSVSAPSSPVLQLFVGPAGGPPNCQVSGTGCNYNPTIREGFPPSASLPSLEILTPDVFGAVAAEFGVTIEWWAGDVSDEAKVDLYYDTDADGVGGQLLAAGIPASEGAYPWETQRVELGEYTIYAILHDAGAESVVAISDGGVKVGR